MEFVKGWTFTKATMSEAVCFITYAGTMKCVQSCVAYLIFLLLGHYTILFRYNSKRMYDVNSNGDACCHILLTVYK